MRQVEKITTIPLESLDFLRSVRFSVINSESSSEISADLLAFAIARSDRDSNANNEGNYDIPINITSPVVLEAVDNLKRNSSFSVAEGSVVRGFASRDCPFREIALVGLGKPGNKGNSILDGHSQVTGSYVDIAALYCVGKSLADLRSQSKAKSVCFAFNTKNIDPRGFQKFLEGFFVASKPDVRFKSRDNSGPIHTCLESLVIVLDDKEVVKEYADVYANALEFAAGTHLAAQLVQAPPNVCNTESLALEAKNLADAFGMKCAILGEQECKELGMGSYLAVHQGSMYEPRFIHMTYTSDNASRKIAFVGKGLCTDTGGYNLKVNCNIEIMKCDMGGAAAVLGAARIIGALRPPNIEVHFIIPAAENMISATAFRPGDVIRAGNGMTIEVGNTDAEGRLTLCDAIVYAERVIQPDFILDCATLTGAITIALGSSVAGLYSTDDHYMQLVLKAARNTGTPVWPMPLISDYRKLLESTVADINNLASSRLGGSITAALFLREFVEKTPWCHIDLAGPAFNTTTKQGTGYGATLLAQIALSLI